MCWAGGSQAPQSPLVGLVAPRSGSTEQAQPAVCCSRAAEHLAGSDGEQLCLRRWDPCLHTDVCSARLGVCRDLSSQGKPCQSETLGKILKRQTMVRLLAGLACGSPLPLDSDFLADWWGKGAAQQPCPAAELVPAYGLNSAAQQKPSEVNISLNSQQITTHQYFLSPFSPLFIKETLSPVAF